MRNSYTFKVLLLVNGLLCLFALFTGCAGSGREEVPPPAETHYSSTGDYDIEKKEHEDTVRNATNIVTANYVETVPSTQSNEYVYEVKEELKGTINSTTFHLITAEYGGDTHAMPITGENAILYLSKSGSVYREHDNYYLMDIAEDTESERRMILEISSEGESAVIGGGHVFTRSEDMADILAVTESIFLVTPKEVYVVGVTAPTTTYTCTVQSAIQGQPEFSEILITFFNDTVTIGERYLVLLADHHKGGKIYTLSSPYSVLTEEEALQTPELKPLLEHAQEVAAPDLPTENEIDAGEQSFLAGNP